MSHLLSNSFLLVLMSNFVCQHFGYFVFPFVTIVAGGLINFLVLKFQTSVDSIVGISGVIFFLFGFWLMNYLLIEIHVPVFRRVMKVFIVGSFFIVPQSYDPSTSYVSHFLGFGLGFFSALGFYLINRKEIRSFDRLIVVAEPDNSWYDELTD